MNSWLSKQHEQQSPIIGASYWHQNCLMFLYYLFSSKFKTLLITLKKVRSSHRRCSLKKGFLKIFIKFTGKYMHQSLFFNEVPGLVLQHYRAFSSSLLRAIIARNHLLFFKIFSNFVHFCPNFQIFCPFLTFFLSWPSRISPNRCFSVNFVKFLRIHFLQNNSGRLLLKILSSQWIGTRRCSIKKYSKKFQKLHRKRSSIESLFSKTRPENEFKKILNR